MRAVAALAARIGDAVLLPHVHLLEGAVGALPAMPFGGRLLLLLLLRPRGFIRRLRLVLFLVHCFFML
ncbi:hypothetical protein D9M68_951780 [compost metagenome]